MRYESSVTSVSRIPSEAISGMTRIALAKSRTIDFKIWTKQPSVKVALADRSSIDPQALRRLAAERRRQDVPAQAG